MRPSSAAGRVKEYRKSKPHSRLLRVSKRQPQPQLYFPLSISCGKTQGLAGREFGSTVDIEGRSKGRSDNVVNAGIVGAIGDVEPFRGEVQAVLIADPENPAQTHVEINIVGSQTGVARRRRRPIVGEVTIAVDVGPGEQIERVPAVVADNRCKLKARKPTRTVERALQHCGKDDFLALIEVRHGALRVQVHLVEGGV